MLDSFKLHIFEAQLFLHLRAKLVGAMAELDHYEFCGHGVILGKHRQ
jgi:hypothetical protein